MLSTPEPPSLADDAYTLQITTQPVAGEYGVCTFGRAITTHLRGLLHIDVDPPVYRENRRDDRQLPKASTWTCTVAGHTVVITMFEVKPPLLRAPVTVYTIHIDEVRVPFEVSAYHNVDWRLARTVWIAVDDLRMMADRRARETADTPQLRDAQGGDAVTITDPAAFRARFDAALRSGPARVDRIFGADDREPGQVAVIAADRTVFWFLYRAETGRASVFAVQEPGREADMPTGAGCGDDGFRLAGDHAHLVLELLALAHRDLTVVRGQPGEFIGVGMP